MLLDFHHGIIQHKTFVTTYLRLQYLSRKLDGPADGQGRLYRIRYDGGKLEAYQDLDQLGAAELVTLLSHPNGWHRDTAQRVLVDRADLSAVPLLEEAISKGDNSIGRINALWTLEGLGKLSAKPIDVLLKAKDPKVVCSALWAATKLPSAEFAKLEADLLKLNPANDEVKIYLARVLGPIATPAAYEKLTNLIVKDGKKPFITAAAFSGLDHHELDFKAAAGSKITDQGFLTWLDQGASDAPAATSSGDNMTGANAASYARGKALFNGEAACFGCHGPTGEGIPNLGPPLDESNWVRGNPEIFARILLHGLTGAVTVNGKQYVTTADMPGLYQNPSMTDEKLADIATYVRNEWSNKATPVKPELFKKVRADTEERSGRPYTEKDLK